MSNSNQIISSSTYNDSQWHHLLGTFDGTNGKLFIDGKLIDTKSYSGGSNNELIVIGGDDSSSTYRPFQGQIDDVRIFNYALTAEQVKQTMNEGSAIRFGE